MNPFAQQLELPASAGRLQHTRTFRGEGFSRWRDATIGIVGVGNIGWRLMHETVLSGARVQLFDPDTGSSNSDTQFAAAGVPKVLSAIAACDTLRPGQAAGVQADIRHVGVGELSRLSVLVDASDDPSLAIPLTQISNGLGLPLVRVALDGSGERELGRVQCSHGGAGHACQLCTYTIDDLFRHTRRTPCPVPRENQREDARRPTLASGAMGAVAAGVALLWAQRLVTGNDLDEVLNRELIIDLSGNQMFSLERKRSPQCLSGHAAWQLDHLDATIDTPAVGDLFRMVEDRLGASDISLEPWLHPLCTEAACGCGHWQVAVGTPWLTPPGCERCGQAMHWFRQTAHPRISRASAVALEIIDRPLAALGLPARGAMFVAHSFHQPPKHFVLA